MSTCNILLFAANPNGVTPLALDEECREIEQKIRAAEYRGELQLFLKQATGIDASTIRIASIRPGSTKVEIDGEQKALATIVQKIRASQQIAQQLALQTGMRKIAWEIDGTHYEFTVETPSESPSSTAHTALLSTEVTSRRQIFISYSHKDRAWLEKLQTMLQPLVRKEMISVWDDTKIKPGAKWKKEIEGALAGARVAVLLVSPDFVGSDFIAKHELPPILDAAEKEGLVILWVYVSDCLYEETEIKNYQAAHNISKPLDSLRPAQQHGVLADISRKIKIAANPQ